MMSYQLKQLRYAYFFRMQDILQQLKQPLGLSNVLQQGHLPNLRTLQRVQKLRFLQMFSGKIQQHHVLHPLQQRQLQILHQHHHQEMTD